MWVDSLPVELRAKINALIKAQPSSKSILNELYEHLNPAPKRKKVEEKPEPVSGAPETNGNSATQVQFLSEHNLKISSPINPLEVIFNLSALTFTSPIRKKFNLVFHLLIGPDNVPLPALSVVNVATSIPEISMTNLQSAIRLCVLMPMLGNSTVPTKKDTAMLCFWLNEAALVDRTKNEPIICSLNLDLIKKQLAKDGKIPPNAELQIAHLESTADGIKPINELIIDFLQRQFSLCGIKLINFMPSANSAKNALTMNTDSGIGVSQLSNSINDFVALEAYKGSKEGSLLLISAGPQQSYLMFGFKKPILLIEFSAVKNISYKDITRFTFSVLVIVANPAKPNNEEVLEFSMIDQKSHQALDDFVKRMNIDDNSFDDNLREKTTEEMKTEADPEQTEGVAAASDDEEEDGTYSGAVEGESDSDIADEFDSNVESEGEEDHHEEEEEGPDDGVEAEDDNKEEETDILA